MTFTDRDLAHAVSMAILNPRLRAAISGDAKEFVDYIDGEVRATEKISDIALKGTNAMDIDIRRRIVSQRLTLAARSAVTFGQENAKK